MKQFNSKFKIYEEQTTHKQWSNYASENVLLQNYNKVHPVTDLTGPVMEYLTTNKPSLAGKKTPLQDWLQTTCRIRTISTDDVKCSHCATSSQIVDSELFYLQARGIGKEVARGLLVYAFAAELVERVKNEKLRAKLQQRIAELLKIEL